MMERRPSTITAPAMAPIAPAMTPSTNAATAGCLPWPHPLIGWTKGQLTAPATGGLDD